MVKLLPEGWHKGIFHPTSSLQASPQNPGRSDEALTTQTTSSSVTFERRGFPYLKTIKFRCSSLVIRAGSKHTGEFHSGNDREGNHRARLKIYKPHGKCIAVTTHSSKERQKHTHTIYLHRPLSFYKLEKFKSANSDMVSQLPEKE